MCPPANLSVAEDECEEVEETELDESENELDNFDGNDDEHVEVEGLEGIWWFVISMVCHFNGLISFVVAACFTALGRVEPVT